MLIEVLLQETSPPAETRYCSPESRLHFSHPWEETELAASHRPSRDNAAVGKQAGERLHYGTVTAGSAEGEAPAPILMRLHTADKARARMRARNNQKPPESELPHGNAALSSCQRPRVWRRPENLADDAKAAMFFQQYMITSLSRRQLKRSFIHGHYRYNNMANADAPAPVCRTCTSK